MEKAKPHGGVCYESTHRIMTPLPMCKKFTGEVPQFGSAREVTKTFETFLSWYGD